MGRISFSGKLLTGTAILAFAALMSSCEKNDIDEDGYVNVKVVNASPDSIAKSFTLANTVLVSGGLNFTESSNYINTNAGSRLVAEFKNEGSTSVYESAELLLVRTLSYTVYLIGEGGDAKIKYFQDDLSSPGSGKASVNFVHLSEGAPSNIKIKNGNGDNLVENITRYTQSTYKDFAPGTLSLQISNTALNSSVGTFDLPDLVAGKIYTIYIIGSSSSNISVHEVVHN
ncbi:protein of unknown function [Chitinophaga sp. CF118]|uniref:DUF4397 domain-containing protein n=1 Tax=Chitinophaga sp. CF118 TaxID=1884367 RepID=UPI0008F24C01|nr:DUF4397 domain-containing protein [Chitinophaga sp. CF118]SFF02217.1 protein of unknown function [Chitinophaga sp. CF118]